MTQEFIGSAKPISEDGMRSAIDPVRVGLPELWAVLRVETRGCGFLPDRRPQILFERHIFHRETQGRFDAMAPGVSHPTPGGYGAGGAHQYDRLAEATSLDPSAALRSASWGIGQVMGFNAQDLGYQNVEVMVKAMVDSEDGQLDAMVRFIAHHGLDRAMRQRDWTAFARGYNGPSFAENHYDEKLEKEFADLSARGLPDLRVRTAQVYLMYGGFDPGPIDGEIGDRTRGALKQFQGHAGLPATGELDEATLAKLTAS
jgi:hypothetical protein